MMVTAEPNRATTSTATLEGASRNLAVLWSVALGLWALAALVIVAAYWGTVESAVAIWWTRPTYGHSFAVLPIAVFVAWLQRGEWGAIEVAPSLAGVLICVAFAGLWLAGARYDVLEAQHIAISGMFCGLAVSLIGLKAGAALWLPLAYLFLLAPSGTPILGPLRDATTFLTTGLLTLTGIPHFADGYLIDVRTGSYVIAPGCAGLNFFLATLTIGPVYCVMMYRSWAKRMVALGIMLLAVVLANGVRVFGIIAIAEATKRQIDISADHLFYGWAFFSVILVVLMGVGTVFADPVQAQSPASGSASLPSIWRDRVVGRMALMAALAVVACVSGLALFIGGMT